MYIVNKIFLPMSVTDDYNIGILFYLGIMPICFDGILFNIHMRIINNCFYM